MKIAEGPIPTQWLEGIEPLQKRIIAHWTVTGYKPDEHSLDSYHFVIDGDGKLVKCSRGIDEPAPHTYAFNSAIGISLACMGGWNGSETDYPPTKEQWETLVAIVRQLSQTYGISIDRSHVLMHGEVTEVLGVDQWGKWDIGYLPHLGIGPETGARCGSELRARVLAVDGQNHTGGNPEVKVRLAGSSTVITGFLSDAQTMVPLRPFVHWAKEAGYGIDLVEVDATHRTYYLNDTNPSTAERRDVLEKGYVQLADTGYAQLRDITEWMGLKLTTETWTKDKRVLVVSKGK
jgi:hypothetical protein